MTDLIIPILLGLFIGAIVGFVLKSLFDKQTGNEAKKQASQLLEAAKLDADSRSKEILTEAKTQANELRQTAERDIKERTRIATELEERIAGREERLDTRAINLDKRESAIDGKEVAIDARKLELDEKNSKVDALILEQEQKLIDISGLPQETAKAMILERVERKWRKRLRPICEKQKRKQNPKRTAIVKCCLPMPSCNIPMMQRKKKRSLS
jgi:Domain of unknown function (DUF3552).